MPVRNGGATVLTAINSVLSQSFDAFDLIVINDGSTDESLRLLQTLRDPRLQVVTNDYPLGLASTLNRGIGLARGRYIARMDSDDISYPDRLDRQYHYLEEHKTVDLLGTRMVVFTDDGKCVGVMKGGVDNERIRRRAHLGSIPIYHPTWMGRAEWFKRHRYDPSFIKSQDYELLLRAAPTSHYYVLDDPRGRLSRRLLSRHYTWRAMRKNLASPKNWGRLLVGGGTTAAKALADVIFAAVPKDWGADLSRYSRPTFSQQSRWNEVWKNSSTWTGTARGRNAPV
jgi:glycosyltransferase involved in cell wall biosynthesis